MIEMLTILTAITVLTIEYYAGRKSKREAVCKVWVQENRSSDWICVDRLK